MRARTLFGLFALVLLLATSVACYLLAFVERMPPTLPYALQLKPGSSLSRIAAELQAAGLVPSASGFVWMAKLRGQANAIKAGQYQLDRALTPWALLDELVRGNVIQQRISIIEGWTFNQFRAALDGRDDVRHDTLGLSDAEILHRIGASESHPEGLFFPDTYQFSAGSSDLEILRQAYAAMQRQLAAAWAGRADALPLSSPYEALILASIVEKETGQEADRPLIAGVFINRLRRGMLLQTDPAVIYGLGLTFDGNLRKRDLQADSAYNTYRRPGLTPTPIALPGTAALQATLHPAQTQALYFVARGDGSSHFSSTLNEHNRAVNRYQK